MTPERKSEKELLVQLMTKAKSGDGRAFERLAARLVPRCPRYFDRSRLNDEDDVRSIAMAAVWEAVCTFDPGRGAHFETHAINLMKNRVRNAIYRYAPTPKVSLSQFDDPDVFLCAITEGAAVSFAEVDPRVLILKRAFERALSDRRLDKMVALYKLKCECPGLTSSECAHAIGVTSTYVNFLLQEMREMLKALLAHIIGVAKPLGLDLEVSCI